MQTSQKRPHFQISLCRHTLHLQLTNLTFDKQGSICETRKGPNRPPIRRGIDISYMPMFWKITAFGHFLPTSGSRKCQKTHLHTKTIHLNQGLYDHPLQRNSLEKPMFRKPAVWDILAKFGRFRWPKMAKTVKMHIYRPRPFI